MHRFDLVDWFDFIEDCYDENTDKLSQIKTNLEYINSQRLDGFTALTLACLNSGPILVKTLLDLGADPNISDYMGRTALFACGGGDTYERCTSKIKLILESGGDSYATDNDGDDYKAYTYDPKLQSQIESFCFGQK